MVKPRHWQDPVTALVAVALLVSPWIAGYALVQPALANAVVAGTLLFVVALGSAVIGRPWVECAVIAAGAWLAVSPWVLELEDPSVRSTFVGLGAAVLVLGLWSLLDVTRASPRPATAARR